VIGGDGESVAGAPGTAAEATWRAAESNAAAATST